MKPVGKITSSTEHCFTDSVLCLGGRCQEYRSLMKAREKHIEYFAKQRIENFMILQVIRYSSIGEFIKDTPQCRFSERSRNDGREKRLVIGVSRRDHPHQHVQRHRVVDQSERIKMLRERCGGRKLCGRFRAWLLEFCRIKR